MESIELKSDAYASTQIAYWLTIDPTLLNTMNKDRLHTFFKMAYLDGIVAGMRYTRPVYVPDIPAVPHE